MAFYWLLLVPTVAYGVSLLVATIGFAVQATDRNEPVRITAPILSRIAREAAARVLLRMMSLFAFRSARPRRSHAPSQDPRIGPVVLVPGLTFGRASLWPLALFLSRRGIAWIFPIDRRARDGTLASEADHLAVQIQRVLSESGAQQVDLVGFSTGGLVAAWLLRHHPDLPVRRLITIATAWEGNRMAVFGRGRAVDEIRYGSHVLDGLWPPPVPVLCIYSPDDLAVVPAKSASPTPREPLPGSTAPLAQSVRIEQGGHVDLLLSARVFRAVYTTLTTPLPSRSLPERTFIDLAPKLLHHATLVPEDEESAKKAEGID